MGERQGRLEVIADLSNDKRGRKRVRVRCDCGKEKTLIYRSFSHNKTQSCGCLRIERTKEATTTHGHTANEKGRTPEYEAWNTMNNRCYNETTESYPWYGGMGIGVCSEWVNNFRAFLRDVGPRPNDGQKWIFCLIDKTKNFGPGNAKWMTKHKADRTRRDNTFYTVNKVTKCFVDWAKEYGIPKTTLHYRVVTKGMNMRDALDVGRGRQGRLLDA